MNNTIPHILFITLLILSSTIAHSQTIPAFTVEGAVTTPLKLTTADLARFKPAEVKAKGKDGKEHTFKGVSLAAILDSAGVTLGSKLRGPNLAKYILVTAADGYQVIFALPEVDPEFTAQTILLTTSADGKPLPKDEGPFRIIAPADKKQARWIRQITSIKIVSTKD